MFDDLEHCDEIILHFRILGHWEVLDGNVHIFKSTWLLEDGILARVSFGDADDLPAGVNSCDAFCRGEPRSALRKDAPTTTNIKVAQAVLQLRSGGGVGGLAGGDEIMAKRVHKMQKARRSIRIPPC